MNPFNKPNQGAGRASWTACGATGRRAGADRITALGKRAVGWCRAWTKSPKRPALGEEVTDVQRQWSQSLTQASIYSESGPWQSMKAVWRADSMSLIFLRVWKTMSQYRAVTGWIDLNIFWSAQMNDYRWAQLFNIEWQEGHISLQYPLFVLKGQIDILGKYHSLLYCQARWED